MSKADDAKKLLPECLKMIESNLMKVAHDLRNATKVAIITEDEPTYEALALYYVEHKAILTKFQKLTRKIVD